MEDQVGSIFPKLAFIAFKVLIHRYVELKISGLTRFPNQSRPVVLSYFIVSILACVAAGLVTRDL